MSFPDKEGGFDTHVGPVRRQSSVQYTASDSDVAHRLEEMGYKQELQRHLGMVSVLGLSFAIMAVSLVEAVRDGYRDRPFRGQLTPGCEFSSSQVEGCNDSGPVAR